MSRITYHPISSSKLPRYPITPNYHNIFQTYHGLIWPTIPLGPPSMKLSCSLLEPLNATWDGKQNEWKFSTQKDANKIHRNVNVDVRDKFPEILRPRTQECIGSSKHLAYPTISQKSSLIFKFPRNKGYHFDHVWSMCILWPHKIATTSTICNGTWPPWPPMVFSCQYQSSHQLDSKEKAEATDTRQQAQRHVHDLSELIAWMLSICCTRTNCHLWTFQHFHRTTSEVVRYHSAAVTIIINYHSHHSHHQLGSFFAVIESYIIII